MHLKHKSLIPLSKNVVLKMTSKNFDLKQNIQHELKTKTILSCIFLTYTSIVKCNKLLFLVISAAGNYIKLVE